MRKLILILLLFVSAVVNGQTPAGYIKANMRFKWTAGIFDSALHVPQYNGTPSGIRNGAWVGDGAIGMDTTNHRMYIYSGGAWLRLAKYSEVATPTWQQTLTAGSTLTGNNTIDGGLNSIDFDDFNGFAITVRNNSGIEFNGYNGAKRSAILVAGDSIVLKLNNSGNFYIDSLQNVSTQSVLLGGTSSVNNRKIGYLNIGTGLSLSSGTLNSVWTASGNDVYNNNSGNVGIGTSTPATKFHTVGTVRHQTLGTAITDTTTYKPLVINSSGDVLPSTYWYGGGGGGSPAGSNKQVQYNNSGSFGGAAGFEYQSGSSPNVTITGQNAAHVPLYVKGIDSTQTADLFRVMRYDDSAMFRIAANGSVTIGPAYDYVNAIHPPGHEFRYSNLGYTGGIKIRNHNSGSEVRLHTVNNGLYITDNGGTAAPMTLGTRTNPADGSTFIAAWGVWTISAGSLGIGGTAHASAQLDASSTTKGFLPPRMTGTQAEAISSPAEGLMVYATDGSGSTITSKGWWGYDGSTWVKLN